MTTLNMDLGENSYPIIIKKGIITEADKHLNLNRKCLIVTDDGVPEEYAKNIAYLCKDSKIVTLPQGEQTKSQQSLFHLLSEMCNYEMGRSDCVVAVGGGVVGDLSGFASSIYMRGVDFYNIPTTLLSQVDSSIGGKTAINFDGIKNIVGSFKQPKAVLIDTELLKTLPKRQWANGIAESVKMAATSDKDLFELFEKLSEEEIYSDIENIVTKSLMIKKYVVENDEKESGLRQILNFGHTYGHGIEANEEMSGLYHGECIAMGMIPMASKDVQTRLIAVLKKLGLPYEYSGDKEEALKFCTHDKKCRGGVLSIVTVDKIGDCNIEKISIEDFKNKISNA